MFKKRFTIGFNEAAKTYFTQLLTNEYFARSWRLPEEFEKESTVFLINDRAFSYNEFGRHLMSAQRAYANRPAEFSEVIDKELDKFFERSILQYREDNLELENEDFANILKEYRDGLLLFDLMEKEIWNKASKDTLGLEAYFQKHTSKYQWNERVDVIIASSGNKSNAEQALSLMKKQKSEEEIKSTLNTEKENNIIFTKGVFNINDSKLPKDFEIKEGISEIYEHNGAFHVINVIAILPAGNKTLEEAKGNVINDYQEELERNWIDSLYQNFSIEVNDKALQAVKEKIKNQ